MLGAWRGGGLLGSSFLLDTERSCKYWYNGLKG